MLCLSGYGVQMREHTHKSERSSAAGKTQLKEPCKNYLKSKWHLHSAEVKWSRLENRLASSRLDSGGCFRETRRYSPSVTKEGSEKAASALLGDDLRQQEVVSAWVGGTRQEPRKLTSSPPHPLARPLFIHSSIHSFSSSFIFSFSDSPLGSPQVSPPPPGSPAPTPEWTTSLTG